MAKPARNSALARDDFRPLPQGIATETYFDLSDEDFVALATEPNVQVIGHNSQTDDNTGEVRHSMTLARYGAHCMFCACDAPDTRH